MFKKINFLADFALNVFMVMVITTLYQSSEAKVHSSLLALDSSTEYSTQSESPLLMEMELYFHRDVFNVEPLVVGMSSLDGILGLSADTFDRKKFKIIFDPRITSGSKIKKVLYQVVADPRLYKNKK